MNLSKSKYCNAIQCNKILWLDKYKSEVKEELDNTSVFENGTMVGEIAKNLFGDYININFDTDLNKMINETKIALKNKNAVITESSFVYNNNFCSVDILKKHGDKYELYEVKSSTHVNDIYLNDISYQYYVLKNLGLNITKASIVYLNTNYVRNGELELDKLFIINDVTEFAQSNINIVKNKINEINDYMKQKDEPVKDIDKYCFEPYKCPYFSYCSSHIGDNNIFNIRGMHIGTKLKYYKRGIYNYSDLLNEKINPKYMEQIDFEINDKEDKINVEEIRKFMHTLSYPIYFLDFETFQQSIPLYDGISPYEQIPFQYSLHYILDKSDKVYHTEFLAEADIDPRYELAKKLVSDIPLNSCVLAYNMSFEKNVIKKLSILYPEFSEHLMNIYNNMKDLMVPFINRYYYTKNMHGSYSIKYVLPALFPNDPSLDYHNLDMVHNGSEASNTYSTLSKYSEEEQKIIKKNMLKYCELDTYAMVKIYKKLKNI